VVAQSEVSGQVLLIHQTLGLKVAQRTDLPVDSICALFPVYNTSQRHLIAAGIRSHENAGIGI
jgi:hypothetical protein